MTESLPVGIVYGEPIEIHPVPSEDDPIGATAIRAIGHRLADRMRCQPHRVTVEQGQRADGRQALRYRLAYAEHEITITSATGADISPGLYVDGSYVAYRDTLARPLGWLLAEAAWPAILETRRQRIRATDRTPRQ